METPHLPGGLTARPLNVDDIDAVVALVNVCEMHDSGRTMMDRADLVGDSSVEGFDKERDWVGVFDGGRPIGWAVLTNGRSGWADVAPSYRGRGIGTWLREFIETRGRAHAVDRVGQTIDDHAVDITDFFRAAGYSPRHASWVLRIDHPSEPTEPAFPEGITVRAFQPGDEDEGFTMFEEAFSEFTDRLPSTQVTWRAMTIERETFTPDDLIWAVQGDRIVGGAYLIDPGDEIWIDKFAVHRDFRHRGIARGMLHVAFRRSFERGYDHTRLSTDSRTGALTLYERIGMRVVESFTNWGIDL